MSNQIADGTVAEVYLGAITWSQYSVLVLGEPVAGCLIMVDSARAAFRVRRHSAALTRGQVPTADFVAAAAAGQEIAGRYKLLQQIGEGGMGTVWMADHTEPVKRRVAVKLIRPERGQSGTILARFEAVRQAIALMDHPRIAKLLDAGTTAEGSPYFGFQSTLAATPVPAFREVSRRRPRSTGRRSRRRRPLAGEFAGGVWLHRPRPSMRGGISGELVTRVTQALAARFRRCPTPRQCPPAMRWRCVPPTIPLRIS